MRTSPFTDEHEQLRDAVRRWVAAELRPNADRWEEEAHFPDEVFRRAGELGFLGVAMPEEYGGSGGDYWSTVVVHEELMRCGGGSIPMALAVQSDMATPPILAFGTEEQKQAYLAPAIAGERIAAIGITEPEAGSDVSAVRTRARRHGGDWIIDGSKVYITNGVRADFVTMVVRTGAPVDDDPWAGISLFLVDTDSPGFEVARALDKVGMRSSDTALLHLADVRVPGDALLGVEGAGFKQIMWELQGERLIVAVQGVAGAQASFDEALAYAKEREAFGRPIGQFQTIKHRLADLATEIEANRRLLYACCDAWDRGVYATTEIAILKLTTAQVACRAADEAVQILGGAGYTRGTTVERAWRDSRVGRIGGGSDEVQREILARSMGL